MSRERTAPPPDRPRVRWWRSIRVRIAVAVALVGVSASGLAGFLVDRAASIDGRERLRDQAIDRVDAAAVAYEISGRLRFGASIDPSWPPPPVRERLAPDVAVTYFDGHDLWASRQLRPGLAVSVQVSGAGLRAEQEERRRSLAAAAAVAAGVSTGLGWLVAGRLSLRLRRAAAAAGDLAAGDRTVRADAGGHDEVSELTRAIDAMADALADRLEVERAFTADVAHELRTPVTALVSAVELLDDDERSRLVRSQVARLRRLIEDLLEISRLESGHEDVDASSHDLSVLADHLVRALPPHVAVETTIGTTGTVDVEPRRVERIVSNLVANAERHGGGRCRLHVEGTTITVDDDGPGFPDDLLRHGPRRFHTARRSGGSGLGLTIATRQAEALGATLTFENRAGGADHPPGARATLVLPPAQGDG